MFRSARSMNSRKGKETQHGIISAPCVGRSRQRESGRCSMQRVRRGYSVEMLAPIYPMIRLFSAACGCRRRNQGYGYGSGINLNKKLHCSARFRVQLPNTHSRRIAMSGKPHVSPFNKSQSGLRVTPRASAAPVTVRPSSSRTISPKWAGTRCRADHARGVSLNTLAVTLLAEGLAPPGE
jgi:hypothetical protein